jgi:nitrite reductase/ring-hydroxylating ferredoxin subunit
LSNGTPFDIEDFGIVLSAGITCPKHGWSFDIHSGRADRGLYKLRVWEVQLRDLADTRRHEVGNDRHDDKEVWVRRKERIG